MKPGLLVGVLVVLVGLSAHAQSPSPSPAHSLDVPFVPTPAEAVSAMLKLAG